MTAPLREVDLLPRLPFATTQFVDVAFPSTADVDLVIRHRLQTSRPDDVRYLVIQQEAAGSIYRDTSPDRRAWGSDYIILRTDTAGLKARLLLFTERT